MARECAGPFEPCQTLVAPHLYASRPSPHHHSARRSGIRWCLIRASIYFTNQIWYHGRAMGKGHRKGWKKAQRKPKTTRDCKPQVSPTVQPPMEPSTSLPPKEIEAVSTSKLQTSPFLAIVGILLAILLSLLQWNGVTVSLGISITLYAFLALIVGIAAWSWERCSRWHIATRCGFTILLVVVCAALGVWGSLAQYWREHAPRIVLVRPYDLTGQRRSGFKDILRIGCVSWSERACVAAGTFLIAFSEAGWKIDSNRVFRLDQNIPTEGISLCVSGPEKPIPNLPPHLGTWHKLDASETTILWAVRASIFRRPGDTACHRRAQLLACTLDPNQRRTQLNDITANKALDKPV